MGHAISTPVARHFLWPTAAAGGKWHPVLGIVFSTLLLTAAPAESAPAAAPAAARTPKTEAQRLHRQGVRCMDDYERSDCAIEQFEALLREDTRERHLLTDALLRLITLYRRTDRMDDIGPLLRQFWDAGGSDRRSRGHIPYSARFAPAELNMMINIDPPRIVASGLIERGGPLGEYLFTCDEVRRHDIEIEQRWHRAAAQAQAQGRETWEVFYEHLDEQAEKDRKRKERREAGKDKDEPEDPGQLMFAIACPLVEALGLEDNRGYQRMTGISHHRERDKMAAIFVVDDLQSRLRAAVAEGRLLPGSGGRYRLPQFEHGDLEIEITSLDRNELLAAPVAVLGQMEASRKKRRRRMNRELDRLVGKVPKDTGMFVVLNQAALRELGFGEMERRSVRSALEALLPRPKGLQMAMIFGDTVGMFTRVPTQSAVRGRMLVTLANAMLSRSADNDEDAAKWVDGLDVAEAGDRKALLASYVLTRARLDEILWE